MRCATGDTGGGTLVNLELSNAEHALLTEVLDQYLRDLKEEIYKTETTDYKEDLKEREQILVTLVGKLGRAVSA
jgi:hypothetical protein